LDVLLTEKPALIDTGSFLILTYRSKHVLLLKNRIKKRLPICLALSGQAASSPRKGFASSIGVSLSRRAGMGTGVDCRHAPKREIFQQKGGLALFFLLDRPGGYGKMLCHRWEGWPCRHMY
jgi:hypothetical protein